MEDLKQREGDLDIQRLKEDMSTSQMVIGEDGRIYPKSVPTCKDFGHDHVSYIREVKKWASWAERKIQEISFSKVNIGGEKIKIKLFHKSNDTSICYWEREGVSNARIVEREEFSLFVARLFNEYNVDACREEYRNDENCKYFTAEGYHFIEKMPCVGMTGVYIKMDDYEKSIKDYAGKCPRIQEIEELFSGLAEQDF